MNCYHYLCLRWTIVHIMHRYAVNNIYVPYSAKYFEPAAEQCFAAEIVRSYQQP